jgi:hypothetical protein
LKGKLKKEKPMFAQTTIDMVNEATKFLIQSRTDTNEILGH